MIHHGIIREDATDNKEVRLDVPLGTDSIRGLHGSKYSKLFGSIVSQN